MGASQHRALGAPLATPAGCRRQAASEALRLLPLCTCIASPADDDVIEKSNLSRQFLFRDWNIGSR